MLVHVWGQEVGCVSPCICDAIFVLCASVQRFVWQWWSLCCVLAPWFSCRLEHGEFQALSWRCTVRWRWHHYGSLWEQDEKNWHNRLCRLCWGKWEVMWLVGVEDEMLWEVHAMCCICLCQHENCVYGKFYWTLAMVRIGHVQKPPSFIAQRVVCFC